MISANKQRVMISLTQAQVEQIDKTANEMGLTRSALIGIATMQYINTFEVSKGITKSALTDAISKAIKDGDFDIERLNKLHG